MTHFIVYCTCTATSWWEHELPISHLVQLGGHYVTSSLFRKKVNRTRNKFEHGNKTDCEYIFFLIVNITT